MLAFRGRLRGRIIKQWVLKYQVWGRRTTEANSGTWAWNGKTLNELLNLIMLPGVTSALTTHLFDYSSLSKREINENQSQKSQWSASMSPLQTQFRFCPCVVFRQGYLIRWFMERVWDCSTQARHSRFPGVNEVSPAVDSGGSFQLWLLWILELPCSRRGHRCSASLTWDLKASASLWLLRRRGWEFWASLFSFS